MNKTLAAGDLCELTIYSSGRREIYDCVVIELCGAAIARVQLPGSGGILRVVTSQLKKLGEGYRIHILRDGTVFVK